VTEGGDFVADGFRWRRVGREERMAERTFLQGGVRGFRGRWAEVGIDVFSGAVAGLLAWLGELRFAGLWFIHAREATGNV